MKYGKVEYKVKTMQGIAIFITLALVLGMFSVISLVGNVEAHVNEGIGDPLQLYSYFDSDASTKINFADSGIGRDPGNYDEWEGAYVRDITITNFAGDDRFCYLFLANDDSFLYIGVVYQADNTGASNYVRIYFDEGSGPGNYDGNHDDALTSNNENYVESTRNEILDDGFFNGASWVGTPTESSTDVTAHVAWGVSYMNYEFKIPIDNGVDGASGSDLNIGSTDELGIFFEIGVMGVASGVVHYWDITGSDPTNVNDYGDLRLGLEKKDTTVYSTFANTGNPIIDGDISNDFAYANAYSRDMTITNFLGQAYRTTMYMAEDPAGDDIFIGVIIYTDNSDSTDYLRVYTDQDHNVGPPFGDKDGILSDGGGQSTENYEEISGDNSYSEGFWDSSTEAWVDDGTTADAIDGEGEVSFKNFAGSANDRYEFEFRLPYSPVSSSQVDGTYDLYITSPQLQGILIEFYDASALAGERYFYWDLTVNLNAIKTRDTAGGIFLSTGWAYLQTGGPALKPITPITGSTVFGTDYVFRVEAEDEDGYNGVNFVGFQIEGQTNWISLVRESTTNGIWFTYWDTTAMPDGKYNLTIVAQDNEGIAVKKMVSVTIANGATLNIPPTVSLTSPSSGSTLTGTVQFLATSSGVASVVEVHLDGLLIGTMSSTGLDTWQYFLDTTNWVDGVHVVNLVAKNAAGEGADAGIYIFNNWDLNTLAITDPLTGTPQAGTINVVGDFAADNSGEYAELFVDDMFWSFSDDTATGAVTFSLDTTLLSEGAHQVKMFVYDPEGNKLMDMVTIYVDNIAPDTPTVVSIIDGQFIEGIFTFQVQCDNTDLDGVDITITNEDLVSTVISAQTLGYNSASGYYEFALDTRALVDGNYSAFAESRDSAGTMATSATLTFQIDNNAPKLMVSSPMDNSMVSGDVAFVYMAEDPFLMGVMYKVDGNSWVDINTTWDTTSYNDGDHTIMIMAADYLGHESLVTLNLVVDNNGPTVDVINPFTGQFVMGVFTFRVAATDDVGVENVHITLTNSDTSEMVMEDQAIPYNSATGHYEYTLDTGSIIDGNYNFSVISYDIFGQDSGDVTVDFMIDNNAPELVIESPLSGDLLSGSVTIMAEVSDMFLLDALYRVDGGGWVDITTDWDTSLIRDGAHTMEFLVTDLAGHETTQSLQMRSDNNGPEIHVVFMPKSGSRVGSAFSIQVEVVDIHDIDDVSYKFGDSESIRMFQNQASGFYEAKVVTDSSGLELDDGDYNLVVTASDIAGMSSDLTRNLTVDQSGPVIVIVSPKDGKTVKGTVEFLADVTDLAGVESVRIRIDKGSWKDMHKNADDNYVYRWNSRNAPNGDYDVEIRAEDSLKNEFTSSYSITVDNFPMLAFMVFIIGIIVFVVMMAISWPKGGKKSKSKAPKEEFSNLVKEDTSGASSEDEMLDLDDIKEVHEEELQGMEEIPELEPNIAEDE
jgi:hypothetical protein